MPIWISSFMKCQFKFCLFLHCFFFFFFVLLTEYWMKFPNQGMNPCPRVEVWVSWPLEHQRSPQFKFSFSFLSVRLSLSDWWFVISHFVICLLTLQMGCSPSGIKRDDKAMTAFFLLLPDQPGIKASGNIVLTSMWRIYSSTLHTGV